MTGKKDSDEARAAKAILRHWREDVPDDRLAHLVRDVARGLTRSLQYRLGDCGVTFGHWVYLRILWEEEGLTQRELSERAGLMEPTTHAAILKMESLGYVERRHGSKNRRKVHVYLTRKGRADKGKLVPLAEQVNRIAMEGVPEKDVAATRRTLLAMVANLVEDEQHLLAQEKRIRAKQL